MFFVLPITIREQDAPITIREQDAPTTIREQDAPTTYLFENCDGLKLWIL
ncbi:MAG: hypothetical protein KME64_32235 [Scytonematopsis contorta HA4267-MV1]|jgi:hypothetical protein|nr:hypothetical protein [Scytonematopsis contorta HA4267-MV1]